jgi:hypothetical protein
MMTENGGAGLTSTRKIYRRELKKYREQLTLCAALAARGRPISETRADILRMAEEHLSGRAFPVGVLPTLWRAVAVDLAGEFAAAKGDAQPFHQPKEKR